MFNFGNNEVVRKGSFQSFLSKNIKITFSWEKTLKPTKVVTILPRVGIGTGYGLPQTRKISLATPRQLFRWSNMTRTG